MKPSHLHHESGGTMTTTTFARAALVLGALALVACGGDGKKSRASCDGDADCTAGVCFQSECYTACTDQDACAADELCVAKARTSDTVTLCVVAADYASCASVDDCHELVPAACQVVVCLEGAACGYQAAPEGSECPLADGAGVCDATDGCVALPDECPEWCDPAYCQDCPAGCPCCGNGACDVGETPSTCPLDCGEQPQPCGDGVCAADESCLTCPDDCDACPGCTTSADCPDLGAGSCQEATCGTDGQCGLAPLPDGNPCGTGDVTGTCLGGECRVEGPTCPNGACDADETCATCPEDCGCVDACTGQSNDQLCVEGQCQQACCPQCDGKACGPDGCGGLCGECSGSQTCSADGQCVAASTCGDGQCGPGDDCVTCPSDCSPCAGGYQWTFDDGITTNWSTSITADPWQGPIAVKDVEGGPSFLGPFGKQTVSLQSYNGASAFAPLAPFPQANLPAHDTVRVTFDLYVLNTWHGEGVNTDTIDDSAPDSLAVVATGTNLSKSWSFSNCAGTVQSYPEAFGAAQNAPKTGAVDTQPLGVGSGAECGDATYHVSFQFTHAMPFLDLRFAASLTEPASAEGFGTMTLADESWGLDNVKIELLNLGADAL
jgi:hypothetical protein